VIYNGVPCPPGDRPRLHEAPPRIGCIGRIAPEKGQREFLAAAGIIHRALPACRFAVYGAPLFSAPRYAEEVRAAAAGLPVEFAGWVPDVYAALADLDLVLAPSAAHEGTPRAIMEAFSAGVPVIAFRAGGIPEILEHGQGGWLAGSVEEMAGLGIDFVTASQSQRAAVSETARVTWRRRFTLSRYCESIVRTLETAGPVEKRPGEAGGFFRG